MDIITYPRPNYDYSLLVKGADEMWLEYISINSKADLTEA